MRRLRSLLPLLALVAAVSCTESGPFVPDIATASFAPSLGVDITNSVRTSSGLYYRDILVGVGTLVPATGSVSVTNSYQGYLRNAVQFDENSWSFTTGVNDVIPGFEEGVRGMRVGGQRQIIVPPHLGYGDRRNGAVPANSILVFFVTVTAVD